MSWTKNSDNARDREKKTNFVLFWSTVSSFWNWYLCLSEFHCLWVRSMSVGSNTAVCTKIWGAQGLDLKQNIVRSELEYNTSSPWVWRVWWWLTWWSARLCVCQCWRESHHPSSSQWLQLGMPPSHTAESHHIPQLAACEVWGHWSWGRTWWWGWWTGSGGSPRCSPRCTSTLLCQIFLLGKTCTILLYLYWQENMGTYCSEEPENECFPELSNFPSFLAHSTLGVGKPVARQSRLVLSPSTTVRSVVEFSWILTGVLTLSCTCLVILLPIPTITWHW